MKCECCGSKEIYCANTIDGKVFCYECIHKLPRYYHYGYLSGNELKNKIISIKKKKWWEFWK